MKSLNKNLNILLQRKCQFLKYFQECHSLWSSKRNFIFVLWDKGNLVAKNCSHRTVIGLESSSCPYPCPKRQGSAVPKLSHLWRLYLTCSWKPPEIVLHDLSNVRTLQKKVHRSQQRSWQVSLAGKTFDVFLSSFTCERKVCLNSSARVFLTLLCWKVDEVHESFLE